ncbi:MAG: hypothetical protein L6R42_007768 [Xanthoria sp. 1 TBL-2021]|nr:MAG: hypothetical protein L6R42_007768 [Xanthoria sp. 1 TBL-2021]
MNEVDSKAQQQITSSKLHIGQQPDTAESKHSAEIVIQGTFSSMLKAMLQITTSTINMNIPVLELGCESLLAVEIRTWLLKELHVEIPTFSIVGGSTAAEICRDATRRHFALKSAKIEEDFAAVKADEGILDS